MATIQDYLDLIKNAIYGKDVRQAIHDGIQQCYYDGKAGSTDLEARQRLDSAEGSLTSLGSRMSTAENDIDVLDSRVDQIVAPSGEAPSAAEVSDARVGADGTTYTSLGDAVRGQVSDLKSDLQTYIYDMSRNVSFSKAEDGKSFGVVRYRSAFSKGQPVTMVNTCSQTLIVSVRNSADDSVIVANHNMIADATYSFTIPAVPCHLHIYSDSYPISFSIDTAGVDNIISASKKESNRNSKGLYETMSMSGISWVLKHLQSDGSLWTNSNKNVVSADLIPLREGSSISVDRDGYKYMVGLYDYATGAFISRSAWMQAGNYFVLDNNYNVRIEISTINEDVQSDTSIASYFVVETCRFASDEIDDVMNAAESAIRQLSNVVSFFGIEPFKRNVLEISPKRIYTAFPFLSVIDNVLFCFYTVSDAHEGTYADIYYRKSENGVIWSAPIPLFRHSGVNGITGVGTLPNGNTVFWRRSGNFSVAHFNFYSFDGSNAVLLSTLSETTYMHIGDIFNVPNVGYMCFYNTYGNSREWGVFVSADDCQSWTKVVIETSLTEAQCPVEICGVYIGNDRILAIGRNDVGEESSLFQIESTDNGQTWAKYVSNISDSFRSSPDLIYNAERGTIDLYYFKRFAGELKHRTSLVSDVWNNPTNWDEAEVIAHGTESVADNGNVKAVTFNQNQICAFYSGENGTTGVYSVIV